MNFLKDNCLADTTNSLKKFRTSCEVCDIKEALYTCPACEVQTCCLACCLIHKKELNCTGIKDEIKFKVLSKFTDADIKSDYMFMENVTQKVDNFMRKNSKYRFPNKSMSMKKFEYAVKQRGSTLLFLPKEFSKRKNNTSHLEFKTNTLYWKIDWIFPDNIIFTEKKIKDTQKLITIIANYIDSKTIPDLVKPFFKSINNNLDDLRILLKAEKVEGNRFYHVRMNKSIRKALFGKTIIEYPTFYVIRKTDFYKYDIINPGVQGNNISKNNFLMTSSNCDPHDEFEEEGEITDNE